MKSEQEKSKTMSFVARIFRIREWTDWDRVRAGGHSIGDAAKALFVLKKDDSVETFDDAQRRMKLTDDDVANRSRALLAWSMVMLILAALLLSYAMYLFIVGSLHAGLFVLVLMCLSLSMSFRYHFWYYQMTIRKLGCSFQDWFEYTFKGRKP